MSNFMTLMTDVVIVGSGPVGLFAVFECGMMKMSCHMVDTLEMIGGQCSALYPEKPIYDIPAHPVILAQQLIDNLAKQIEPFNPIFHLNQKVEKIESLEGGQLLIETSLGTKIQTKVLMIAAGVGAFGPNRPPLDGIENFENKSIFYHVKRREDFRGKRIVIAGGGDSAVDWALSLSEIAAHVMVVHRRARFRAAPESTEKLQQLAQQGKIELIIPYQLAGLEGESDQLTSVIVETLTGEKRTLEADILLPFFGLSMNLGPIADWGLGLSQNHVKVDRSTMQTSVPGIYAIGDIAHYENKLKLILTGFAEAAQAAHSARGVVYPREAWHFEYSTTQGLPK